MRYVLDSCVALKWLLTEVDSDKALRIRDASIQQVLDLVAPDILPVEAAHSLSRAERQGRITPAEGVVRLGDLMATLPVLQPHLPLLPRAYELSSQARIGGYDCLYVALSDREGCELLTADRRLANTFPSQRIVLFSSLP
jgi:predicted nucleic acid-binding protein